MLIIIVVRSVNEIGPIDFQLVSYSLLPSATGATGNIRVNGKPMSTISEKFRRLSCYIHQDDLLRPQLLVGEIMLMAAHLKLGFKVSKEHKLNTVSDVEFNNKGGHSLVSTMIVTD